MKKKEKQEEERRKKLAEINIQKISIDAPIQQHYYFQEKL